MRHIATLIFIFFILNTSAQMNICIDDSILTQGSYPAVESIFTPSTNYPNEVFESCDLLSYDPMIPRVIINEFSIDMILDSNDWYVFTDTSFNDTVMAIYDKYAGSCMFKKWHINGKLMQEGKLQRISAEDIIYQYEGENISSKNEYNSWVDPIVLAIPVSVGKWSYYDSTGTIASEGEHLAKMIADVYTTLQMYEDGDSEELLTIAISDYCSSLKQGKWTYYKNGKVVLVERYENGKVTDFSCRE